MKRTFLMVVGAIITAAIGCFGQSATIVGTVTDPSGAAIPGAKITVENSARGFVERFATNSDGAYTAAFIPTGDYQIIAEASGFKQLVHSHIVVHVGALLRVNLRMQVGSLKQEVNVRQGALHVETDTAANTYVITGKQLTNLNINGRDFAMLTLLVPGASPRNSLDLHDPGNASDMVISFNGARHRMSNFTINGEPDIEEGGDGTLDATPNLDSIAEFRLTTGNYGAQHSHVGGAQVSVETKSGTRQFHGDAFDYVRNDAFDANGFFANRVINPPGGNAPTTPLHWNDFGFTLGGPVYIPGHYNTDKTKTFFFYSQEFHRYNGSQLINEQVPSVMERRGEFSQCDPASGDYNPVVASGCSLPVSTVDGNSYDAVQAMPEFNAQNFTDGTDILNAWVPLPNNGVDYYTQASPTNDHWAQELIRIDQHFTDKTSVYFDYIHEGFTLSLPTGDGGGNDFDTSRELDPWTNGNGALHITHIFTPNLVNDFMIGYHEDNTTTQEILGANNVAGSLVRPANFKMNHIYAADAADPYLPGISVSTGVPFNIAHENYGPNPWPQKYPLVSLADNATRTLGKHILEFGFYGERYGGDEIINSNIGNAGFITFDAGGSITTGNGMADMLLGMMDTYAEASFQQNGKAVGGYGYGRWRNAEYEPYINDTWKVTPRLTLNLGVRYTASTPNHDITHPTADTNFVPSMYNPTLQAQLDSNTNIIPGSGFNFTEFGNGLVHCGVNGIPTGCTRIGEMNFAQRFGFAFDPTGHGKTVIRGGYGMYFSPTSESNAEGLGGNPPTSLNPQGFNIFGYNNIVPGAYGPYADLEALPLHEDLPYMENWSFGIQHAFSGYDLLTLSYVGSVGHHLTQIYDINQVPLNAGTDLAPGLAGQSIPGCDSAGNCDVQTVLMNQYASRDFFRPYRGYGEMLNNPLGANSNYNSLQASYRHSFSHGLTFQASYTWAHELDNTSGDGANSTVDDSNPYRWYGDSRDNRAQMFVMNYVYNLPFFAHTSNRFLRGGMGGWILSGISTFYTGAPRRTYALCGVQGFRTGIGEHFQCNTTGPLVPDKHVYNDPQFGPTVMWFNPNVMSNPTEAQLAADGEPGMFGYMGRNALAGPGRANWDIALLKNFKLPWFGSERSTLQFRLETFNTFNTPEWESFNFGCSSSPNSDGSPAFGRACGGATYNLGNGEVNSTFDPRIVQFALKLLF
jgi:hypothetical protein